MSAQPQRVTGLVIGLIQEPIVGGRRLQCDLICTGSESCGSILSRSGVRFAERLPVDFEDSPHIRPARGMKI